VAEHQGVRGELTVERLVEEEHWVKLSTCEGRRRGEEARRGLETVAQRLGKGAKWVGGWL